MSNNSNRARQFFSAMESLEERVLFDGMPDGDLSFLLPGSEQPVPAQVQLLSLIHISEPTRPY